jgi:hypothetical protein
MYTSLPESKSRKEHWEEVAGIHVVQFMYEEKKRSMTNRSRQLVPDAAVLDETVQSCPIEHRDLIG